MTKLFLIAATLLTAAAAPAVAHDARPARGVLRANAVFPEQRYCVVDTITGSRIPHKVCQTRAQWIDDGIDPLAKA